MDDSLPLASWFQYLYWQPSYHDAALNFFLNTLSEQQQIPLSSFVFASLISRWQLIKKYFTQDRSVCDKKYTHTEKCVQHFCIKSLKQQQFLLYTYLGCVLDIIPNVSNNNNAQRDLESGFCKQMSQLSDNEQNSNEQNNSLKPI